MNTAISSHIDALWQAGLAVLQPTRAELERGLELHRELDVCDGYGFLPRVFTSSFCDLNEQWLERGIGKTEWLRKYWAGLIAAPGGDEEGAGEFLAAIRRAGLKGLVQPVNDIGECFQDAVSLFSSYRHLCHRFPDALFQATTAEQLTARGGHGRMGIVYSLTGLPIFGAGSMADPDDLLDWVDVWHRLGVRFMHLGYNRRNCFADGCTETADGGLSDFGRALVERLNATGIVIDISHNSIRTTTEAIKRSTMPVVATHTGCATLHDHPRCKSDETLKALAATGGYAGIFAVPSLLGPGADLRLLLAHVQHAVSVVGVDHVSIGTDNSYLSPPGKRAIRSHPGKPVLARSGWKPEHKQHESQEHLCGSLAWTNWPLITVGLLKLGFTEDAVARLLGGNLRRVLQCCAAAEHAAPERRSAPAGVAGAWAP